MAAAKPPGEFRSVLERAGVGRRGRLLAAILLVVLIPLWLPLFFGLIGLVLKVLKPGLDIVQSLAAWEETWRRWRGAGAEVAPRPGREMPRH